MVDGTEMSVGCTPAIFEPVRKWVLVHYTYALFGSPPLPFTTPHSPFPIWTFPGLR